jgi:hypothetical protein
MGRKAISIEQIVKRDGMRCHYCDELMNIYHTPNRHMKHDPLRFTFEHVVPKCQGGSYGLYNIVGACHRCNSHMGSKVFKCFCAFCMNARAMTELREVMRAAS